MNRNSKICLVMMLVFVTPLMACPPTPLGWTILDPIVTPTQSYSGDIACEGEATTSANYIIKIVDGSDILQSVSGTSTQCAWATTVTEPNAGWQTFGNLSRHANLQLYVGGNKRSEVGITLLK